MSTPKFVIYTGGDLVLWAPKFNTRREAALWLDRDLDWEQRTEVEYEGASAHALCGACGEHGSVDLIDDQWLCDVCQTPDTESAYVMCQVCGENAWATLITKTAPLWTCEDCED